MPTTVCSKDQTSHFRLADYFMHDDFEVSTTYRMTSRSRRNGYCRGLSREVAGTNGDIAGFPESITSGATSV
jgi:hypothetical protein